MLVSLYLGNSFIKVFALVSYCFRIIIVIIWGAILMYRYESFIGYKLGKSTNDNDQLALYFLLFITVREMTLVPVLFLKSWFKNNQTLI